MINDVRGILFLWVQGLPKDLIEVKIEWFQPSCGAKDDGGCFRGRHIFYCLHVGHFFTMNLVILLILTSEPKSGSKLLII